MSAPRPNYSARECLRAYTNETLAAMCQQRRVSAGSKAARLRALEKVLADPLHARDALGGASPETVRLLHIIERAGAPVVPDLFSVPGLYGTATPEPVLGEVLRAGLAWVVPDDTSGVFSLERVLAPNADHPEQRVFVPDVVARQLPAFPPLEAHLLPCEETCTPAPISDDATTTFLETLRIIDVERPRVTAAGSVHRTDASRAADLARETGISPDAMNLALMTARELGCVEVRDGRLATTKASESWAEAAPEERMRMLLRAFAASQDLSDLRLFFPQVHAAMEEHLPEGSLRRTYHRALAIAVLREAQPDTWYTLGSFASSVRVLDANVLFLNEKWRALLANVRGVDSAWRNRAWETHERRFFEWLVRSVLAGMGIVQLAEGAPCFRLTQRGVYALSDAPAEQPRPAAATDAGVEDAAHDALVVQPDFEVLAYLDRCPADLRRKLDSFCDRVRSGAVTTYRLSAGGVYRGIRAGNALDRFLALLEENSRNGVPENVRAELESWRRKLESITLHVNCQVLEYPSRRTAEDARGPAPGSPARWLGPRHLLVARTVPGPHIRVDYRRVAPACLVQDAGLTLRAPWERSDLFCEARLQDLGDAARQPSGDLVFTLKPGEALRDLDYGLLVAELESLCVEPLAARYKAALRAACGESAAGLSRTATLLRFADAETCQAALEMPEANALVEGRLGLFTLVIRQGKLAQFKKHLRAHGIPVTPSNGGGAWDDGEPAEWAGQWLAEHDDRHEEPSEAAGMPEPAHATLAASDQPALPSYPPRIMREILEDALTRRRPVLIAYETPFNDRPVLRRVNPVTLDTAGATPTLSGYCHVRQGSRTFKLAQVRGVRVLEEESF